MKTTLIMVIEHSKPIPDLTDIAAGRVYTLDGVKDVTATIQETVLIEPDTIQVPDLKPDGTPRRYTWDWATGRLCETRRGLWVRHADHVAALKGQS